ncbi:hypothetical protein, partial [Streptomyces blattellae]|uniref:hypothetical protein n=1 Tax=Streptomyces blattellae TaxID=2569855 RepID=UPI001E4B9EEE
MPVVGALVRDTATNKDGVYMGQWAGRHMIRPLGGGLEWDATKVRPLTAREELSARLAVKNSGNRWG